MTLKDSVDKFINIAKKQPNINYANEGDIYKLNSLPNIDYGVFWVTQTDHVITENTLTYNLVLFYVDRLFQDESNTLEVQSTAILQLNNIINQFIMENDVELDGEIKVTTFTQRFTDFCAGAWAEISIVADNNIGICGY